MVLPQIRVLWLPPPTLLLLLLLMEFYLLPYLQLLLQLLIFGTYNLTLVGQLVWIIFAEQFYLSMVLPSWGSFRVDLFLPVLSSCLSNKTAITVNYCTKPVAYRELLLPVNIIMKCKTIYKISFFQTQPFSNVIT